MLIVKAKQNHVKSKIEENKNNPKQLHRIMNGLMRQSNAVAIFSKPSRIGRAVFTVFEDKILKLRNELDSSSLGQSFEEQTTTHCLGEFQPTTSEEIVKLLTESPNKNYELDKVPTWMLKTFLKELAPALTSIVNESLSSSDIPKQFKHALVRPLIKKSTLDAEVLNNFRPVSNLNFISKLIEKIVSKRLRDYISVTGLGTKLQSAYRPGHSTETALLRVHNDLVQHVEQGNCAMLVLLDLSAAFDTIDQGIVLSRLSNVFGIHDKAPRWIKSYLTNRSQAVCLEAPENSIIIKDGEPSNIRSCSTLFRRSTGLRPWTSAVNLIHSPSE